MKYRGCGLFQGNFPTFSWELGERHNKLHCIRFLELHKHKSENLLLEPLYSVTTECLSGNMQMEGLENIPVLNFAYTTPRSCRLCKIQRRMLSFIWNIAQLCYTNIISGAVLLLNRDYQFPFSAGFSHFFLPAQAYSSIRAPSNYSTVASFHILPNYQLHYQSSLQNWLLAVSLNKQKNRYTFLPE